MTTANQLTASQAREALQKKEISALELLNDCLSRIEERDNTLAAWCELAKDGARILAKKIDETGICHSSKAPALSGLPVGVKDIIDTADLKTTYGSNAYTDHRPNIDAACVALVRAAKGIIIGKTVSTEFAYFQPGKTTNPHNIDHTPGGSSSGSAAAVADYMVPFAFGTQTGGSVIRPAAFCGVVGYKASYGALPLFGVKALSHDLDTLGFFCREVADIHLMRSALIGSPAKVSQSNRPPRIGLCRTYEWEEADQDSQSAVLNSAKNLDAAGATIIDIDLAPQFSSLVEMQKIVMAQNAARDLAFEYNEKRDFMSSHILALIEQGKKIDFNVYQDALIAAKKSRLLLNDVFDQVDILLCPSAPGEAPKGLHNTGDPVFNRLWTFLGNPCLNLPGNKGRTGLPVGVQAIGPLGADEQLLLHCHWMEERMV